MNHYKLLALDLDGTLLNHESTIPSSTISAVKQASKYTHITIATGRTFYSAHYFAKQLNIDIPLIACNGAIIKTTLSDEVLYRNPLSSKVLCSVVKLCKEKNFYYHGYSESKIYLIEKNETTFKDGDTKLAPCEIVDDLLNLKESTLLKLTILGTEAEMNETAKIIQDTGAVVIKIKPTHLEVIERGANKGTSLKLLANRLNIPQNAVIACGDGENDIDMITWAGLGVAVANANSRLKERANYIAKSESSLGVEEIINEYILK